jgi:hypothetical protein
MRLKIGISARAAAGLAMIAAAAILLLAAACGDDDNASQTPTGTGGTPQASHETPAPTGSPVDSAPSASGLPADCTAGDTQIGLISSLKFGEDDVDLYTPGQQIQMILTLTNCADNDKTLYFTTTQRYTFFAQDPNGNQVWSYADGKVFSQVTGTEVIPSHQSAVYTEIWDQKDSNGEQVPNATYKISAFSVGCPAADQVNCHFGPVRNIKIEG